MTTDLKQELERMAGAAPAYDVLGGAIALHRRRRRIRYLGAVAGVAALLAVVSVPLTAPPVQVAVGAGPSLPKKLAMPRSWTPNAQDDPAGPASLIFSGYASPFNADFDSTRVAVAGAREDTYRVLREGYNAGNGTLLSPDGTRLVYYDPISPGALRILDLRTGDEPKVPRENADDYDEPLAWSPDGRRLLVRSHRSSFDHPGAYIVGTLDVATGAYRGLPEGLLLGSGSPSPYVAAFSADGSKVAYQAEDHIYVAAAAGELLADIKVEKDQRLAGKGAWTPDGKALAIVDRFFCCRTPARAAASEIALVEVASPHRVTGRFDAVQGATAIEVQGWAPDGAALAVASFIDDSKFGDSPANGPTTHIKVVALRPGAAPTVLLAPPVGVSSVDIASEVIAGGLTRPGVDEAPWFPVHREYALIGVGLVAVVTLMVLAPVLLIRRWRRRRRP